MAEPTLAASITRTLVATAERLGLSAEALLEEVGILKTALAAPDGRIPVRQHIELFRRAALCSGRPDFALEVGRAFRPGTLSAVSHAAMHAPSLGAAWTYFSRYWHLVAEGTALSLEVAGTEARVRFEVTDPALPPAREGSEAIVAGHVLFARWLTQRELVPSLVAFAFEAPEDTRAHRALFGCAVRFGADRTEVRWANEVMGYGVVAADPTLEALFRKRLRATLSSLERPEEPELHARVRAVVLGALEHGEATLDHAAKALFMSRRSLQRRLNETGTSFQALLDESRRALCFRALKNESMPVEEVAFMLGYAEPSAFFRAFRRWTGTTPARWRAEGHGPKSTSHGPALTECSGGHFNGS